MPEIVRHAACNERGDSFTTREIAAFGLFFGDHREPSLISPYLAQRGRHSEVRKMRIGVSSRIGRTMSRRPGFTLIELLVVIAIIGVLVALLLPAIQAAREAARRSQCQNNLKQIGLALLNFETAYGTYPGNVRSGITATNPSGFRQGWMLYITPFLERQDIFDAYNFEYGWNNAENTTATGGSNAFKNAVFVCPTAPAHTVKDGNPDISNYPAGWNQTQFVEVTDYSGFIGVYPWMQTAGLTTTWGPGLFAQIIAAGATPNPNRLERTAPPKINEITDGTSKTFAVAESAGRPFVYRFGKRVGNLPPATPSQMTNGGGWSRPASDITLEGLGAAAPGTASGRDEPGQCAVNCTNGHDMGMVWQTSNPRGLPSFSFTGPSGTPVTVDYQTVGTSEVYSFHTGGAHFLMADGSVQFVNASVSIDIVAKGITINTGEVETGSAF